MRLFDTHCHFEFADEVRILSVLRRARAAGVERLLAVGGSVALNASAEVAASLVSADIPVVTCAQGYDREQVESPRPAVTAGIFPETDVSRRALLSARGEIGLDYHYSPETREAQRRLFAAELEEARRRNLPVSVHTREADDDTIALLREIPSRGIIHCYTGDPEGAKRYLDLGFYVSMSGIVTFRAAANVRETAKVIPDDRILIETDSPFLAPVPMRGQSNEPAFLRHTCEFLARLRGMSADAFAELTFRNAESILGPAGSARQDEGAEQGGIG